MEHRELMAQDEDFDVLGSVSAESQRHLRLQLCEHLVDQLRRYLRIMSGWLGLRCSRSTAVSTISGTNRSGWPAEADPVAKVVGNDRWQRDGHPARAQHVQIVDAVWRWRAYRRSCPTASVPGWRAGLDPRCRDRRLLGEDCGSRVLFGQPEQGHQPHVRHEIVLVEARGAGGGPLGDSH